jgi:hypothetical protein
MKPNPQPDAASVPRPPASAPRPLPASGDGAETARRIPLRLALGLITGVGILVVVWLIGYLGFARGFAPLMRVDQLQVGPGGGLATGTIVLISVPRMIILAGGQAPGWLMLLFVLVAVPAAGLSATRTVGPPAEPGSAARTVSYAGAVAAGLHSAAAIWWTASGPRLSRIQELPFDVREAVTWLEDLQTVAGLDVLIVIATALWAILVLRIGVSLWLKALAASATFFALVVVSVAMATSNTAAAEIRAPRSVVFLEDGSLDARLLLGFTRSQVATLRSEGDVTVVELHDPATMMTVIGRQSIVGMLEEN